MYMMAQKPGHLSLLVKIVWHISQGNVATLLTCDHFVMKSLVAVLLHIYSGVGQ